jgi:peptide/nickel transport system permease protein
MIQYCIRRVASAIPVLLGISIIAFALGLLTPGDPARMALDRDGVSEVTQELLEAKREELGLNDPGPIQYGRWLWNVLHGDFGTSYSDNTSVSGELLRRLPVTLKLAFSSVFLVILFGITGGILAAANAGKPMDHMLKFLTNLMLSFPSFWMAILLIIIFAENLKLLPTSGMGSMKHLILPSVTLASANIAMTQRLMRSSMLTEFGKQYILAANAKGIEKWCILFAHAMPNAVIPVITLIGNYIGGILGGSFIIENIFSLPGIGSYALSAIHARDYPVIQGYVLVTGITFVTISLLVDLFCAWINPKMRLGGKKK